MIDIDISRIAFSIGPLSVGWYGIMIALAVLTLVWWVLREAKRGGRLSTDIIINGALIAIPSGIVLSRLVHVIDQWGYYSQNPGQIIGGAGLAIWGAVLGAALALWVYSRIRKFSFLYLTDLLAPGIILAQAIGRVGCTLNGCCYGVETDGPIGIIYTNPDSFASAIGVAFQPTQVYEIIYNLIVFAVLLKLRGRFKPDGSLFLIYLSFYSLWRFGIDFIRDGTPFLFGLHQAQVVSLVVLAITIPLLALRTRLAKTAVVGNPSP